MGDMADYYGAPEYRTPEEEFEESQEFYRREKKKVAHYQQHPLATPRSAYPFLEQKKIWVDRSLESVKIKDMDQDYLMATMTWLLKRAEELKFAQELYFMAGPAPQGDMAQDEFDRGFTSFLEQDARAWMKERPLFQRLMKAYRQSLTAGMFPKIQTPLLDAVDDRGY